MGWWVTGEEATVAEAVRAFRAAGISVDDTPPTKLARALVAVVDLGGDAEQRDRRLERVRALAAAGASVLALTDMPIRAVGAGATEVLLWPQEKEMLAVRAALTARRSGKLPSGGTSLALLTAGIDAMSAYDTATLRFLAVNDAWCSLYGYTRDEALAMGPLDVSAEAESTRAAVSGPPSTPDQPTVRLHRKKSGAVFPVELLCHTVEEAGQTIGVAVLRDVSGRIEAEDALRRSEARFRAAADNSGDALLLLECVRDELGAIRDFRIAYLNARSLLLLGQDAVGQPLFAVSEVARTSGVFERFVRVVTTGTALHEEVELRPPGRPMVIYESHASRLGDGLAVTARNVTARKAMETRLQLAERMASLGTLAASVAHEVNTPLAYVLAQLELLDRALAGEGELSREPLRQAIGDAREGAERVRSIARDLRSFAYQGADEPHDVDVQRAIDAALRLVASEVRGRARIVEARAPTPHIVGTEQRLVQVLVNLITNAAQALPERSRAQNEIRVTTRVAGAQVVIEVSDNGPGIPPELVPRIFEPFFTTKAPGKGTGLGLATVLRLVRGHQGFVQVQSAPGQGTTFACHFPLSAPETPRETAPAG
jgi:PAS domain S-box-containing protein